MGSNNYNNNNNNIHRDITRLPDSSGGASDSPETRLSSSIRPKQAKQDSSNLLPYLDSSMSPEMLFLIKEHSKTRQQLSKISKRLKDLEDKVNKITQKVSNHEILSCNNNHGNNNDIRAGNCKSGDIPAACGNISSDDSGGEYSRTTNGTTDEDELLSLLDLINKHSYQIRQKEMIQDNPLTCNSTIHSFPQPIPTRSARHSLNIIRDRTNLSPFHQSSNHSSPHHHHNHQSNLVGLTSSNDLHGISESSVSRPQSLSALLFEPNTRSFLDSVNDFIDEKPSSCLSLDASQVSSNHHPTAYQSQSVPSSEDAIIKTQLNHAHRLSNKKHTDTADEWLSANPLLSHPTSQPPHLNSCTPSRNITRTWHN